MKVAHTSGEVMIRMSVPKDYVLVRKGIKILLNFRL